MCIMSLFKKKQKQEKEWTFNDKLVVKWSVPFKTKYNMEKLCKIILSEILKIDDVELTVAIGDSQIRMFDTPDFELQAMLTGQPQWKKYTLLLRSNIGTANVLSIVCHEMWHLAQMYKGDLAIINKNFKWRGQNYPGSTPYFDRPWEKEAIKEQYEIERKVKQLYFV